MLMVTATVVVGVGAAYFYIYYMPKMRKGILSGLNDPASAQFQKESLRGKLLCGEVNAKNGFGGYFGFTRFISYDEGYAIQGENSKTLFYFKEALPKHDDGRFEWIIEGMKHQLKLQNFANERLAKTSIEATDAELREFGFNALWETYCKPQ